MLLLLLFSAYISLRPFAQAVEKVESPFFFIQDIAQSVNHPNNLKRIDLSSIQVHYKDHSWSTNDWCFKVKQCFSDMKEGKENTDILAWKYVNVPQEREKLFAILKYGNSLSDKAVLQAYISSLNTYTVAIAFQDMIDKNIPLEWLLPYIKDENLLRYAYYFLKPLIRKGLRKNNLKKLLNIVRGLSYIPTHLIEQVTINSLEAMLKDPTMLKNFSIASCIVNTLKKLGKAENTYEVLTQLFEDKKDISSNYKLLVILLKLIGKCSSSASKKYLIEIIDNDDELDVAAIEGLGFLEEEEVTQELIGRMYNLLEEYTNEKDYFNEDQKQQDDDDGVKRGKGEMYEDLGSAFMKALAYKKNIQAVDVMLETLKLEFSKNFQLYFLTKNTLIALQKLDYQDEEGKQKVREGINKFLSDSSKSNDKTLHEEAEKVLQIIQLKNQKDQLIQEEKQNKSMMDYLTEWNKVAQNISKGGPTSWEKIIRSDSANNLRKKVASNDWLYLQYRQNLLYKGTQKRGNNRSIILQYQDHTTKENKLCHILMIKKRPWLIDLIKGNKDPLTTFVIILLISINFFIDKFYRKNINK